jgi:hypothetical protein
MTFDQQVLINILKFSIKFYTIDFKDFLHVRWSLQLINNSNIVVILLVYYVCSKYQKVYKMLVECFHVKEFHPRFVFYKTFKGF